MTFFAKPSSTGVWQGSEYASGPCNYLSLITFDEEIDALQTCFEVC